MELVWPSHSGSEKLFIAMPGTPQQLFFSNVQNPEHCSIYYYFFTMVPEAGDSCIMMRAVKANINGTTPLTREVMINGQLRCLGLGFPTAPRSTGRLGFAAFAGKPSEEWPRVEGNGGIIQCAGCYCTCLFLTIECFPEEVMYWQLHRVA